MSIPLKKTYASPTPAWVIGTYDKKNHPNILTVAWGGVCCSKPPCVTISLRKATYSYASIVERQAYTVNILGKDQVGEIDYVGIASGRDRDKFGDTGLTPVRSELVDAPYVGEALLVLECRVIHTFEIGLHSYQRELGKLSLGQRGQNTAERIPSRIWTLKCR